MSYETLCRKETPFLDRQNLEVAHRMVSRMESLPKIAPKIFLKMRHPPALLMFWQIIPYPTAD